jgi:hypothetical protein
MDPNIYFNITDISYTIVEINEDRELGIDKVDISVFTNKEWEELLKISDEFCEKARFLTSEPDEVYRMISSDYKNAVYFLNSIGLRGGLRRLEYMENCGIQDIHNLIYDQTELTINKFRRYISKHYLNIKENYKIIME